LDFKPSLLGIQKVRRNSKSLQILTSIAYSVGIPAIALFTIVLETGQAVCGTTRTCMHLLLPRGFQNSNFLVKLPPTPMQFMWSVPYNRVC